MHQYCHLGQMNFPQYHPAVAVEYFRAGANAENAHCIYLYARCLDEGIGMDQDPERAAEWYRKAVMAGSSEARAWMAGKEAPSLDDG